MNTPLVSIIIPVFNREALLSDTLDSILSQSYPHWECFLVDDGSTDQSRQVASDYAAKDKRFIALQRPEKSPKGANACRNYGRAQAQGELINFFDSDDLMYTEKLTSQVAVLQEEHVPFTICQSERFDVDQKELLGMRAPAVFSENALDDYIQFKIFWLTGAPLWRRSFLDKHTLTFDERLQQSQDYDFHIRALACSTNYHHTDEVLVRILQHDDNMSNDIRKSPVKIRSNTIARHKAILNHHQQLSQDSILFLFNSIFDFYKISLKDRFFTTAKGIKKMLHETLPHITAPAADKSRFKRNYTKAFVTFVVTKRGDQWLKRPDFLKK